VTTAELLEVIRDAVEAATVTVTAGHEAPAEITGVPAVILRPADPWVVASRRAGVCPEVRWSAQLVAGRYDTAASLGLLATGFLAARAELHRAGVGQVGPLEVVGPVDYGTVPMLAGSFNITLDYDPGGP
jgi:hypothetical protein